MKQLCGIVGLLIMVGGCTSTGGGYSSAPANPAQRAALLQMLGAGGGYRPIQTYQPSFSNTYVAPPIPSYTPPAMPTYRSSNTSVNPYESYRNHQPLGSSGNPLYIAPDPGSYVSQKASGYQY